MSLIKLIAIKKIIPGKVIVFEYFVEGSKMKPSKIKNDFDNYANVIRLIFLNL